MSLLRAGRPGRGTRPRGNPFRRPARLLPVRGLATGLALGFALLSTTTEPAWAEERIPLAEIDGETIYVDEVEGALALRIYQHQLDIYSLLKGEAERRLEETLLRRAAKARGRSTSELLAEIESAAAPPDEAAIDAYLREHPIEAGGKAADPAKARERVRHYLTERARIEQRLAFQAQLRSAAGARVLLDPPARPRTDFALAKAPVRGPADAPVTLIHFASLGSRHARRSAEKIEQLMRAYPGKIRWAHVHLLNDRDEAGLAAARISKSLSSSDQFWKLHDALFQAEGKVGIEAVETQARRIGLTDREIRLALSSPETLAAVKKELDRARTAGIPREPSLFINGFFVSGLVPFDELDHLVAEALRTKEATNTPREM